MLSIVKDKDSKDSEAANDAFPDETLNFFLRDSGQRFGLDSFGEVFDPYDEELEFSYDNEEGSYYVQSLLGEQPGDANWCKFLRQLSHDITEALALVTRIT